ncbi:putative lipid II flippase FtsW [Patescibacteria group bacterium]|nr:putative lipid II flippase FtsW [Patescibacteria group bacterium]
MGRRRKKKINFAKHRPDLWLVGVVLGLAIFGVIMIANVSPVAALSDYGDRLHFAKLQALWALIGLIGFGGMAVFPYQRWRKFVPFLLGLAVLLLLLVVLPSLGLSVFGAQRWLSFGFFSFQPIELVKLIYLMYLAAYLEKKKKPLPLLLVSLLIIGLIMAQPDLGSTVVVAASGFLVYFVSGAPWWQVVGGSVVGLLGGFWLILGSAYRKARLLTLLNPLRDPLGASYHIRQILIAIGSGGLFGVGLGQSKQKYEYLPAVATDSIFAVVAEELGFIGGLSLIVVYVFFVWRGLRVAQASEDLFGRYLAVGIVGWLGIQTAINLAAMVALVPLTGITLPLVSYGGSSLVSTMMAAGVLVNISQYTTER